MLAEFPANRAIQGRQGRVLKLGTINLRPKMLTIIQELIVGAHDSAALKGNRIIVLVGLTSDQNIHVVREIQAVHTEICCRQVRLS